MQTVGVAACGPDARADPGALSVAAMSKRRWSVHWSRCRSKVLEQNRQHLIRIQPIFGHSTRGTSMVRVRAMQVLDGRLGLVGRVETKQSCTGRQALTEARVLGDYRPAG